MTEQAYAFDGERFWIYSDTGCMGSEFFHMDLPASVTAEMGPLFDWGSFGLRTLIDTEHGSVAWLKPSVRHYAMTGLARTIAEEAGRIAGIPLEWPGGRVRWKHPDTPETMYCAGMEADIFFLSGESLDEWKSEQEDAPFSQWGTQTRKRLAWKIKPALVIETENPTPMVDSPRRWAEFGVPEMWRLAVPDGKNGHAVASILDLASKEGPKEASESRLLPGLTADTVRRAAQAGMSVWPESAREAVRKGMAGRPEAADSVSMPVP